jgi:uncharacterized protein (DUF305 family)
MTTATKPQASPEAGRVSGSPGTSRRLLATFAIVLSLGAALAASFAALGQAETAAVPTDDSADAGFARDMSAHHTQAVVMALIMVERTEDPAIRVLATDILLTQQAQVGMMKGWLDVWGASRSSLGRRMAWMGHAMDGPMPGMATDEEVDSLRELPPAAADRRFLELMIRHHEGGLAMAQAGLDLGREPVVRRLAEAILTGQQTEIRAMQDLLLRLGGNATPEGGA